MNHDFQINEENKAGLYELSDKPNFQMNLVNVTSVDLREIADKLDNINLAMWHYIIQLCSKFDCDAQTELDKGNLYIKIPEMQIGGRSACRFYLHDPLKEKLHHLMQVDIYIMKGKFTCEISDLAFDVNTSQFNHLL